MPGLGRIISSSPRRPATGAIMVAAGAWIALPALALAKPVTVHTSRGGTCRLQTVAKRTGPQITYGVRVRQCSTRFGVRYVVSRGALYDESNGDQPVTTGYLGRMEGRLPYQHQRSVSRTSPADTYRTTIDVSVVLRTRRAPRTRHPERWTHSGSLCRVKTTDRQGDTLGCEISDNLPGA